MDFLADEEIKAIVLDKLRKRGCWGGRYPPFNSLIRWLSREVKRNGGRIRKTVKHLVSEGFLILHKGGKTVSLNPTRSREITDFITGFLP